MQRKDEGALGELKKDVGGLRGDVGRLAIEVVKNAETISHLATRDDLSSLRDEMRTGFDKVMVVLERLDQERHFTFEAVRRLESNYGRLDEEVKTHRKEIDHIKEILKV